MTDVRVTKAQLYRQAEQVFGARAEALAWFRRPALSVEQRRPTELLDTSEGRQRLQDLLIQLEYSVYI